MLSFRRNLRGRGFASLAIAALATGCDNTRPGAGITNPGPGSMPGSDKAATRTDTPVAGAVTADPVAEAVGSQAPMSNPSTGPAGGQAGGGAGGRQAAPEAASSAPGVPPVREGTGNAQGGTKPDERPNSGTPRSPQ
jgi:hypothetical protein